MNWIIPGTTLKANPAEADEIPSLFHSMFLAGGLTLSQVATITGLETHTIQNWVKRGFLPPPRNKRYDMEQLCRILNINILKAPLPLEQIIKLMAYLNGNLSDESDDLIDDCQLYFLFVRLAANHRQMHDSQGREQFMKQLLDEYEEPVPGSRQRVENVLRIMLTAWAASQLRQAAEHMLAEIMEDKE